MSTKNLLKQVDKAHYSFESYIGKARWASIWHQLDEILRLKPAKTLEVGPGPGTFKIVANSFGFKVETLDIDPDLEPDHFGVATDLPFSENSYDVVCSFQMLEHLPYESSLKAFEEMVRVSKQFVVISLPDSKPVWRYIFHIAKMGDFNLMIEVPFVKAKEHIFDGEHYWEVNKKGYELERVINDFGSFSNLIKTFRVIENPYHRFFVFQKSNTPAK